MPGAAFWDVDTQHDFISPGGALYIDGAEAILPNLSRLTARARLGGIRILGSVDSHADGDRELSENPDFQTTFPPHCLRGTPGQEKVEATRPENPLWIDPDPLAADEITSRIGNHRGEIFFRKRHFDVFTNPNVEAVLDVISPDRLFVYGVALDVCDAFAIDGFLERRTAPVTLVLDATRAIDPERGRALVSSWVDQGVDVVDTHQVVAQ